MYLDRRYRPNRRRSLWPAVVLLFVAGLGGYLLLTRTDLVTSPLHPGVPTPEPTRSVVSYLAEAEDHYRAGRLAASGEAYAQVTEMEPRNDRAWAWLARLWVYRGYPERGVDAGRKAVAINPGASNLAALAFALDWSHQFDEAQQVAEKAVEIDPQSGEALAALTEVYADNNQWYYALETGKKALAADPDNAYVLRSVAYMYEMQGQFQDALATYQKAAELQPTLGIIYLGAGHAYAAIGDQENSIKEYEKAAEVNPDIPTGLDTAGYAIALAGQPKKGISMLEQAIEVDSDYGQAYAHLGEVYYLRLNYEAAVVAFEKAFELGVADDTYYYEAGASYAYVDDCQHALPWLQKALDLNPDSRAASLLKDCPTG